MVKVNHMCLVSVSRSARRQPPHGAGIMKCSLPGHLLAHCTLTARGRQANICAWVASDMTSVMSLGQSLCEDDEVFRRGNRNGSVLTGGACAPSQARYVRRRLAGVAPSHSGT
jgi:hypothetical protein